MRESIDPLLNGQHADPDDDIVDAEILDDDPTQGRDITEGVILDGEVVDDDQDDDDTAEQAAAQRHRALFDWAVVIVVALLVAFLVRTFVLAHFVVDGTSMFSTLHDDDRVFVNKLSYRLHDPNRGDVVVLHQDAEKDGASPSVISSSGSSPCPARPSRSAAARCSSTAQTLEEPYLDPEVVTPGNCGGDLAPITIPEDHVFVMGDNRGGSQDSRALGPIEEDDLVGRAFVVFWPQSHWQWL